MFENLTEIKASKKLAGLVRFIFEEIMGIDPSVSTKEVTLSPEIEKLIALREEARHNKEWARADELRDQLIAHGYVPQDKKL
jgi:cysteinyl-tRNA synthetase